MNSGFRHLFSSLILSLFTLFITCKPHISVCQIASSELKFFEPDSQINTTRIWTASSITGVITLGSGIGLYNAWYSQYDQSAFHFFNDWNEWQNMDKYGHAYTTYFQSETAYKVAHWAGIPKKKAIFFGTAYGLLAQTTVEVFDGFSTNWGFSLPDFAFNCLGAGLFAFQQSAWDEQRIRLKFTSRLNRPYEDVIFTDPEGNVITNLQERVYDLYGKTVAQRFIKDYNSQTIWLSVNPSKFGADYIPNWLSIAVGIGGENMFGGFQNSWTIDGQVLSYPETRYVQFYIAPDLDWSELNTSSHFLKTLFGLFNTYRLPMPAVEYNVVEGWSVHLLMLH